MVVVGSRCWLPHDVFNVVPEKTIETFVEFPRATPTRTAAPSAVANEFERTTFVSEDPETADNRSTDSRPSSMMLHALTARVEEVMDCARETDTVELLCMRREQFSNLIVE